MYFTAADSIEVAESFISVRCWLPSLLRLLLLVTASHRHIYFSLRSFLWFVHTHLRRTAWSASHQTSTVSLSAYFVSWRLCFVVSSLFFSNYYEPHNRTASWNVTKKIDSQTAIVKRLKIQGISKRGSSFSKNNHCNYPIFHRNWFHFIVRSC